ncbi:unnamed protein product [Didymodactylos carnosus]|uniref:ATP-dependent RNA helicase n=1 Tax=Didymodactylos carnosus TaxID=1234261 RepID=A0A8S2HN56_9BILA|nr:unnamed protein product [Didymodactylos carnosus]CAF3668997.1 unnamed protein product [Didymodactylos carnosus]
MAYNPKVNGSFRKQQQYHEDKPKIKNFTPRVPQWQKIDEEISELTAKYNKIDPSSIESFTDFPLSRKTLNGLKNCGYSAPTDIQREAIGVSLQGRDVLGAAKTGSGKTLAFLIPILECLYRSKWTLNDGLGVLIISPTRELAYQTFEILKKIGQYHDFSAGLIIGGKDLRDERDRISRTNIIVCTPGRLLQHLDETSNFNCDNLKMFGRINESTQSITDFTFYIVVSVLDEADRILDMGFADTMKSIIENLPSERQTLLFSATQTRSVRDLALLSLTKPVYVSVHENSLTSTPATLTQVKYLNDVVCKLRPGLPVLALYGSLNQLKRMSVYDTFCRKQYACLFATDIAARGLDFPAVDWVIQYDCPPDANTYIHRVGRTARFEKGGEALLLLTEREERGMIKQLEDKKVPLNKIEVNPNYIHDLTPKLQALCAQYQELKEEAKRAFTSYLRSLVLMGNRRVFDVHSLNTDQLALSLGLVTTPKVRFLKKRLAQQEKKQEKLTTSQDNDHPMPVNQRRTAAEQISLIEFNADEGNDELFTIKRTEKYDDTPHINSAQLDKSNDIVARPKRDRLSKVKLAKKLKKKNLLINSRVQYDDDGNPINQSVNESNMELERGQSDDEIYNVEKAKERLRKIDEMDKELYREHVKQKHQVRRIKEKEVKRQKQQRDKQNESSSATDEEDTHDTINIEETSLENNKYEQEESNISDDIGFQPKKVEIDNDDGAERVVTKTKLKRKHNELLSIDTPKSLANKRTKKSLRKVGNDSTTINDDEQLALYFLSK